MGFYQKESLELLRQRIDLVEVVSPHVKLQKTGAAYKACCPFHEEKTPSFVIQKGEQHYHCYGCGAHGDAIAFMMNHLKMNFLESIEALAEKFQIRLEKAEPGVEQKKGPSKSALKEVLEKACQLYQFLLLHSEEGRSALSYLFKRGITLDFIRKFRLGFASKDPTLLRRFFQKEKIHNELLEQTGLINDKKRDFFSERILFPITDSLGNVIGFSARKFKEETFGGKYINTPETPLFKKSQILFGLSYSRARIIKERKALVVEGQIDALRLIDSGFDYTVAGQGTAFGEGHVRELLQLKINHVYLALDGDEAGAEATVKIGNLFQKKGVEVSVVKLPAGLDPDTFLKSEGPIHFQELLDTSADYLKFCFERLSRKLDISSPSKKNELVNSLVEQIRTWEEPVMVHETLRKLALMASVPESMLSIGSLPGTFIKQTSKVDFTGVNPDRILETDLLRWLFLLGESMPRLYEIVRLNISEALLRDPLCKQLFSLTMENPSDLFSLAIHLDVEGQLLLEEIMKKKVNMQKAEEHLIETVRKILIREWMHQREAIKIKIQSGQCTDAEALDLAKQFDQLKKSPPEVSLPTKT